MSAWLLIIYAYSSGSSLVPMLVPNLESEAECHRVFTQLSTIVPPGYTRTPGYKAHHCIEYFIAVKP